MKANKGPKECLEEGRNFVSRKVGGMKSSFSLGKIITSKRVVVLFAMLLSLFFGLACYVVFFGGF